jgi:hypothetical protein
MSANDNMLTSAQCRAARALTDISRATLSEMSGIEEADIRDFERKLAEPAVEMRSRLRQALETHGAIFLADDSHGGQGVRLKFSAAEAARIERLENEGGPTGEDDVAE